MNIDLNIKYYYIINEDLKMSKGKIAAQVSHVAMQLGAKYGILGSAIILKAPERELRTLMVMYGIYCIEDAGLTEVPKDSLTCVGFMETESTRELTKNYKLL